MNRCIDCDTDDLFDGDLRCLKCENRYATAELTATISDDDHFGEGRTIGERLSGVERPDYG